MKSFFFGSKGGVDLVFHALNSKKKRKKWRNSVTLFQEAFPNFGKMCIYVIDFSSILARCMHLINYRMINSIETRINASKKL